MVTTKQRKGASKGGGRGSRTKQPEKRRLNRVGTHVNEGTFEAPHTVGQRMAQRRLELRMTQDQVAGKVVFTPKSGKRENDQVVLSRNAYCMYETGGVEPDLPKIEGIAKVLGVSPAWLAFGIGEPKKTPVYIYDTHKKSFVVDTSWVLGEEWLKDHFASDISNIGLFAVIDYTANFTAGDVAIVQLNVEPNAVGGEFVFAHKNAVRTAHLTRPPRSVVYRVFSADLQTHEEIPIKNITLLGKVIGKVGSLERA